MLHWFEQMQEKEIVVQEKNMILELEKKKGGRQFPWWRSKLEMQLNTH